MINNKIKMYRAQFNLTQEDLAKKAGVTRQTIIAIEKNKYVPSLELAFKISEVFNEPITTIFEFKK
ncbi:helix-turn-helix transcriptional regulator [Patescibacteria group bacterium]